MLTNAHNPEDVVVRLADEADLGGVLELLRTSIGDMQRRGLDQWDEQYPTRATVEADVRTGALYVAVTDSARSVVGAFTMNQHQDPEYGDVAWGFTSPPVAVVHRLMVHPDAQRTGLGRFLMRFAERRALKLGFHALRLDTLDTNVRALALYRGLGYREAGLVTFRKGLFVCFETDLRQGD